MLGIFVLIKPFREHSKFFMLQFNSLGRPEDCPNTLTWIIVGNIAPGMFTLMFFDWLFAAHGSLTFILVFITGVEDGVVESVSITWGRHKYKTRNCTSIRVIGKAVRVYIYLAWSFLSAIRYLGEYLTNVAVDGDSSTDNGVRRGNCTDTPVLMIG